MIPCPRPPHSPHRRGRDRNGFSPCPAATSASRSRMLSRWQCEQVAATRTCAAKLPETVAGLISSSACQRFTEVRIPEPRGAARVLRAVTLISLPNAPRPPFGAAFFLPRRSRNRSASASVCGLSPVTQPPIRRLSFCRDPASCVAKVLAADLRLAVRCRLTARSWGSGWIRCGGLIHHPRLAIRFRTTSRPRLIRPGRAVPRNRYIAGEAVPARSHCVRSRRRRPVPSQRKNPEPIQRVRERPQVHPHYQSPSSMPRKNRSRASECARSAARWAGQWKKKAPEADWRPRTR